MRPTDSHIGRSLPGAVRALCSKLILHVWVSAAVGSVLDEVLTARHAARASASSVAASAVARLLTGALVVTVY